MTGSAERFAASRLVLHLALTGEVCFAHKDGSEQAYVHRRHWRPDLPSPDEIDAEAASLTLVRRYLAAHGPATATDLAHFFGGRVTTARQWLERLGSELAPVRCGDRAGLVALREDLSALREEPPAGSAWPLRLLPQWDGHLMRHKDRTWLLERPEQEAPLVWRKAAVVKPVVLVRGRIVAVWSHRATTRRVRVEVEPLSGWRPAWRPAVEAEAAALAAHLELPEADVSVV